MRAGLWLLNQRGYLFTYGCRRRAMLSFWQLWLHFCLLRENYPHAKIKSICLYEVNGSSIVKLPPREMSYQHFREKFPHRNYPRLQYLPTICFLTICNHDSFGSWSSSSILLYFPSAGSRRGLCTCYQDGIWRHRGQCNIMCANWFS